MHSRSHAETAAFRERVTQLIGVLRRHRLQHTHLSDILRRKKEALVGIDRQELERVLDNEREAIAAIGVVEEERIGVTGEIASALGLAAGPRLRLAELATQVDDDQRDELLELREELRDTADSIDRLNRLNRTLTVESLEHVQLYIALLTGRDPTAKTYGKKGIQSDDSRGVPSLLVDRRI